jgi:hypothetical protein
VGWGVGCGVVLDPGQWRNPLTEASQFSMADSFIQPK